MGPSKSSEQYHESIMKKIVHYKVDLNNLTPVTAQQQAELKSLSEMPNESIDYSDIPLLAEAFWKDAVRNPFTNIYKHPIRLLMPEIGY
jgi:hypothetical protein